MRDILAEIWSTTQRNKLRTALTGFAVAWGIFMLIFLLGAGNGLIHAVESNSGRYLDNSMAVYGGETTKPYDGLKENRDITLKEADMQTTTENFGDNIVEMGAELSVGSTINAALGSNYISGQLMGVYPNEAEISKFELLYGRFINQQDNDEQRKVVVIDQNQAKELLPGHVDLLVGRHLKIGSFAFQVVGIIKSDQSSNRTYLYVPFHTARVMYNKGDQLHEMLFSFRNLETEEANEAFEKKLKKRLNANHRAAPDDDGAVWIWNRFTQAMQMNKGMGMVRTALWIVGIFTLVSGIVGVTNIMLITVKERTREFGIRKAIGAKPFSILRLIMIESIIITTFFGYIGMLMGIGANLLMDTTIGQMKVDSGLFTVKMFENPTVGFDVCIEALIVMVVAGTIAGLLPARRAARIRPIEALRAE